MIVLVMGVVGQFTRKGVLMLQELATIGTIKFNNKVAVSKRAHEKPPIT